MKILISGTTGGIGGAVSEAARAAGHTVLEVNRADYARGDAIVAGAGADAAGENGAANSGAITAHEDASNIDAVVFATGTCPVKPLGATDDALFAETVRVNCGLFLRLMREIVARRLYNPSGMRALAVSSVSATDGWAGGAAYCASKGALSALCRAMDAELRPRKISVAAIEPRYVKTAMFDSCAGRMGVPASAAVSPAALAKEILAAISGK